MKKLFLLLTLVSLIACKQTTETKNETEKATTEVQEVKPVTKTYPENISKVFEAHGGLDTWNTFKFLEFTMKKPTGNEVTTTDLNSRKSLIDMPNHTLGYNGKDVWLHAKDTATYKGNAKFYYNLMFYFYAMPFILADDGIVYTDVEPLVFEGKSYPGINISYNAGVGESPEDEYILYYDSETNKMAWLSYTVTYFTKAKSKEFHYIKYSNWQTINNVLLPETLTWYESENNVPTTKRNDLMFTNIKLTTSKPKAELFEAPEGARL
ncbi:hypothetical protein [uncultured Algibacter sp.]|uniref:hypothetical protein n=1 Tax=uncultured Algibacter sp. TaxID=298659 RepID=UPI00321673BA